MDSGLPLSSQPFPSGPQCADGRSSPKLDNSSDQSGNKMNEFSATNPGKIFVRILNHLTEGTNGTVHRLDSLDSVILMLGDAVIKEEHEYVSRQLAVTINVL